MSKESRSVAQVRIIYIVTTIFLAALSIFTFLQIKTIFESYSLISHINLVKSNLLSISASLTDAEKSVQGFLMTGDSIMLRNCDKALQDLEKGQQVLDSLISDDQAQVTNLAGLKVAIANKITSIHKILHESTPSQLKASARVNYDEGIQKMDSVNVYLARMTLEESGALLFRTEKFDRLSLVAPMYIIVIFLGALLILFFSYFSISAELRETRRMHLKSISQHKEKVILAEELVMANQELAFQNEEKEKRAAELTIANKELAIQNQEKEKRAAELIVANTELAFQNEEKEKRAAELVVANKKLEFESEEKEKRAVELYNANKELQLFLYISSHDLQEPLRKIQMSASRIDDSDYLSLSAKGRDHFVNMQLAASSMQTLIEDLLTYSRTNTEDRVFVNMDLKVIIAEVMDELKEVIEEKQAVITGPSNCELHIIPFQFRHLIHNMITNSLKFSVPGRPPQIEIKCSCDFGLALKHPGLDEKREYCHIAVTDNGIGFEPIYNEKIFEVFQRLYGKEVYKGTGIGLSIAKKIVENHNGLITACGELGKGATFDIYIPTIKKST